MSFDPLVPTAVLAPGAAVLVVWAVVLGVTSERRARGVAVASLRVLATVVLAVALLRPIREVAPAREDRGGAPPASLPAGMLVAERRGPELPAGAAMSLAALEREGAVARAAFDLGDTEGFRAAVRDSLAACGARPAAALFVLGELSRTRTATAYAARLASAGVAVSAVAPREDVQPKLSLGPLELDPEEPRARGTALAAAELTSVLASERTVTARWTLDGRAVATRELRLPPGDARTRVDHLLVAPAGGLHRLRVEVEPPGTFLGEEDAADSASGTFFLVRPGPRRVLMVEGAPRPVYRSVRRALASDERFALSSSCAAERRPNERLLPRSGEAYSALDLVILGGLGAGEFAPGELAGLATFVREGGGLVVVAGGRNLGAGSWDATPLAGILPVRMSAADRAAPGPLDARPAGRVGEPRPFPFGSGLVEGIEAWTRTRAETRRAASSWRELPELEGAREVAGTSDRARVPIVAVRPGRRVPLLVTSVPDLGPGPGDGPGQRGRAVVVLSEDIARWAEADSASLIAHDEFWRDIAAGAARAKPDEGPAVWLERAPGEAAAGTPLALKVYLADPSAVAFVDIEHRTGTRTGSAESHRLEPPGLVRSLTIRPNVTSGTLVLRARAVPRTPRQEAGREPESAPLELRVVPARNGSAEGGEAGERGATPADGASVTDALRALCLSSGGRFSTSDGAADAVAGFAERLRGRVPQGRAQPSSAPAPPGRVGSGRGAANGRAANGRGDALPPVAWAAVFAILMVSEWALRRAWEAP